MPLAGTPTANFSMKDFANITINADVLQSWGDGTYTYTVPTGQTGPSTVNTLNGTPIARFDNSVLQFTDASYDRSLTFRIKHFVLSINDNTKRGGIEDSGTGSNRVGLYHNTNAFELFVNIHPGLEIPRNDNGWMILTTLQESGSEDNRYVSVWINDTKVMDRVAHITGVATTHSGSTLGTRGDIITSLNGKFDLAQHTSYFGSTMPITETEIEQNIAFLDAEWNLGLVSPTWRPYKVNGDLVDGVKVLYITADDRNFTNASIHGIATTTGGTGEAPPPTDIPAGKHVFVVPSYEVPDPAPSGFTIGDTYSEIGKWIGGFPT